MGIFTRYDQVGPGVYADDPVHGPFVRFFQTYVSHLLKMFLMNLIFVVSNIPSILIGYIAAIYYLPQINPVFNPDAFTEYLSKMGIISTQSDVTSDGASMQLYFLLIFLTVMFVIGTMQIVIGPVQAGLCYLYRNYARESTSMFWPDFVSAVKKNWKQSTIASIISIIVSGIIMMNISFYGGPFKSSMSQLFVTIFVMVYVFFICIQMYVYPLIASVDLKMKNIYKNAILFFLGRFIPTMGIFLVNILVLLVIPVILLLSFTYFGFSIAIFYYLFFAFSFTQYLNSFFVWQQIEKYIVKPQQNAEKPTETPAANETEANDS